MSPLEALTLEHVEEQLDRVMMKIEVLELRVEVLQAAVPRGRPRWVSVAPVDAAMARRMKGPAPIPLTFTIPPREKAGAGIGFGHRRCLTVNEVKLLTGLLSHAHPMVQMHARSALKCAREEGRLPGIVVADGDNS